MIDGPFKCETCGATISRYRGSWYGPGDSTQCNESWNVGHRPKRADLVRETAALLSRLISDNDGPAYDNLRSALAAVVTVAR